MPLLVQVRGLIRAARFKYPQLAEHARWFDCGDASGLMEELEDLVGGASSRFVPAFLLVPSFPLFAKNSSVCACLSVPQALPACCGMPRSDWV